MSSSFLILGFERGVALCWYEIWWVPPKNVEVPRTCAWGSTESFKKGSMGV